MKWLLVIFCIGLFVPPGSSSPLVLDYPISLYYRDSRLSTVLWFRPPYCLYELWAEDALDSSQATRQTTSIEMEVKPEGDNSVYKANRRFPIPICSPVTSQVLGLADHAFEMGPTLACLNDSCTRAVLPGRKYRIRFLLYNQDHTLLAATDWSQHFRTRDLPRDFRTIDIDFGGHSAGMLVITTLLSMSMLLLLCAAGLAMIVRPP